MMAIVIGVAAGVVLGVIVLYVLTEGFDSRLVSI